MVLSSPYYRCAQTACEIARHLRIPVGFDLDLGEVFDDVYMPANTDGLPMHRDLAELSYILDHESAE